MEIRQLDLPGVVEITPQKFGDARGFFSETFSKKRFADAGLVTEWVQDNQSFSAEKFVLRGLHFQVAPFAQDKLVRVLKGSIFDVAVDIRKNSPNFGHWVSCMLSANAWNQLLIPKGYAHGFLTLEPEAEVFYKVSAPYAPECDRAIRWDDPSIAVAWPLDGAQPILSGKDQKAPLLSETNGEYAF
jgi:dTDP-4-dehydrorhamnose 3,5-epimerase